ncbi:hypothetical protein T265_05455 [Opisthorchis viverrini]|uniref:Uncharacterized protein n=1 Tax=Opisthorchis viverrini TaxID=6198 RepID=A0A074ZJH0_OPIVI|nr:hypothetical protein T265_05455 [Opisthorchis viverrini]KER27493.1 hypothetical protein T265_05455 [Opisthorchis viverrini]
MCREQRLPMVNIGPTCGCTDNSVHLPLYYSQQHPKPLWGLRLLEYANQVIYSGRKEDEHIFGRVLPCRDASRNEKSKCAENNASPWSTSVPHVLDSSLRNGRNPSLDGNNEID